MDMFSSEEMELVQLIIPAEAAHDTVQTLGSVGLVAFRDLNREKSAFQKTYANQVKRCDEMLRKLRFFAEHASKAGITVRKEIGGDREEEEEDGGGGRGGIETSFRSTSWNTLWTSYRKKSRSYLPTRKS